MPTHLVNSVPHRPPSASINLPASSPGTLIGLHTPNTHRHGGKTHQNQHSTPAVRLLFIAAVALSFGVLIYITARAPNTTDFLPAAWNLALPWPTAVLMLTGSLPTFFHTLGFCLVLVTLSPTARRSAIPVCTGVFVVEAVFEFGQHPQSGIWLAEYLPLGIDTFRLPNHTASSLLSGVFDPFDLIAAAAGAVLAVILIAALKPETRHRHA